MTTGNPITAIGYNAGLSNSTGTFNTAMGFEANKANTNGYSITAVGARAAWVMNGGNNFTAIGTDSGRTSSTAVSCSFFGANSGFSNTTGNYNTAIGDSAGYSNQAGTYNTFVGYQAGYSNNVAGTGAGCFIGQATGYSTTGAKNTFVGGNAAGYYVTSGASNTILGNFQGNSDGLDIRTASNYAVIADGDGNRQITMKEGQTLALDSAVPNAGTGITFPATQSASSDANTLDDYEEGSFTPTIIGSSTSGTGTYSVQQGTYTKVGRAVSFRIYIEWSAHTGTGNIRVASLPFTVSGHAAVAFGWVNDMTLTANNYLIGYADSGTTLITILQTPVGGGSLSNVGLDTAASFMVAGTYFV
jgi:hypothetical protein